MLAFLSSVLAEFIAGLAVWAITNGPSRSGGQQTIVIERAFFIDSSPVTWGPSTKGGSSGEEVDPLAIVVILGIVVVFVVAAIAGIAALYAQHIDLILATSFWVHK